MSQTPDTPSIRSIRDMQEVIPEEWQGWQW